MDEENIEAVKKEFEQRGASFIEREEDPNEGDVELKFEKRGEKMSVYLWEDRDSLAFKNHG